MGDDDFIGLPPGMLDSGTFRAPVRTDRPRTEKPAVVFVPTVPGMPIPSVDADEAERVETQPAEVTHTDVETGEIDAVDVNAAEASADEVSAVEVTRRELGDDFVVPGSTGSTTAAADAEAADWVLTLANGTTSVLHGATLLGRDPAPIEPWASAALLALDDTTRSVSKTHAALEPDGSGLWVHDLHSTNGVWVVVGEDATEVAPGRRVAVPAGATIELGQYEVRVSVQASGATSGLAPR